MLFKRCSILDETPVRTSGSMDTASNRNVPFHRFPPVLEYQREQAQRMLDEWNSRASAMKQSRECILRCEPYAKVMCDLRSLQPVRHLVAEGGGLIEQEVLWREDSKKLYDMCQEMIDSIGKEYTNKGGL